MTGQPGHAPSDPALGRPTVSAQVGYSAQDVKSIGWHSNGIRWFLAHLTDRVHVTLSTVEPDPGGAGRTRLRRGSLRPVGAEDGGSCPSATVGHGADAAANAHPTQMGACPLKPQPPESRLLARPRSTAPRRGRPDVGRSPGAGAGHAGGRPARPCTSSRQPRRGSRPGPNSSRRGLASPQPRARPWRIDGQVRCAVSRR
jgi:hypothetical protein